MASRVSRSVTGLVISCEPRPPRDWTTTVEIYLAGETDDSGAPTSLIISNWDSTEKKEADRPNTQLCALIAKFAWARETVLQLAYLRHLPGWEGVKGGDDSLRVTINNNCRKLLADKKVILFKVGKKRVSLAVELRRISWFRPQTEGNIHKWLNQKDATTSESVPEDAPKVTSFIEDSGSVLRRMQSQYGVFDKVRESEVKKLSELCQSRRKILMEGGDVEELNKKIKETRVAMRQGRQLAEGEFLSHERYMLQSKIGEGGFGTVWKADDNVIRGPVAIKVLESRWLERHDLLERFDRGARQMLILRHPNIVRVLETAKFEDGVHYFVMEYIEGTDLHRAVMNGEMRFPVRNALSVIRQIGDALQHAHNLGMRHRDVKPSNILLGRNGQSYLTDFDLVWNDATTGGSSYQAYGHFMFAAPECLFTRDGFANATIMSEVYSLAMCALFILYGNQFSYDIKVRPDVYIEQLFCPRPIRLALLRALDTNPLKRFDSISEFCKPFEIYDWDHEEDSNTNKLSILSSEIPPGQVFSANKLINELIYWFHVNYSGLIELKLLTDQPDEPIVAGPIARNIWNILVGIVISILSAWQRTVHLNVLNIDMYHRRQEYFNIINFRVSMKNPEECFGAYIVEEFETTAMIQTKKTLEEIGVRMEVDFSRAHEIGVVLELPGWLRLKL